MDKNYKEFMRSQGRVRDSVKLRKSYAKKEAEREAARRAYEERLNKLKCSYLEYVELNAEPNKYDLVMNKYLTKNDYNNISQDLKKIEFRALLEADFATPGLYIIFGICFGYLGIDRFLLHQPVLGFLKLITVGGAGIWQWIDVFRMPRIVKKVNYDICLRFIESENALSEAEKQKRKSNWEKNDKLVIEHFNL